MTEIQLHPTLDGILVRSDGWIFLPSTRGHTAHWTKGSKNKDNYYRIKYKQHILYVHRLVAETFIPNPDNKPCIDHIDRDPTNNNVQNLRWATLQENQNNRSITLTVGERQCDLSHVEYARQRNRKWWVKHKDEYNAKRRERRKKKT